MPKVLRLKDPNGSRIRGRGSVGLGFGKDGRNEGESVKKSARHPVKGSSAVDELFRHDEDICNSFISCSEFKFHFDEWLLLERLTFVCDQRAALPSLPSGIEYRL